MVVVVVVVVVAGVELIEIEGCIGTPENRKIKYIRICS